MWSERWQEKTMEIKNIFKMNKFLSHASSNLFILFSPHVKNQEFKNV